MSRAKRIEVELAPVLFHVGDLPQPGHQAADLQTGGEYGAVRHVGSCGDPETSGDAARGQRLR